MRPAVTAHLVATLAGCSMAEGQPAAAASPDGVAGTLLVANKHEGSLSRIDLASGAESMRVDTCANPNDTLVYSGYGSRLYSAETAASAIAEIDFDRGEVLRRPPTGERGDCWR